MKEKSTNWITGNDNYFMESITNALPELPVGVYRLEKSMRGLYLALISPKFTFPYKVYGMETDFIKRVVKTFNTKSSSVGVLLNGVKGTGKTVTAELIANQVGLPVIVVNQNFQMETPTFINSIEQDVILFFDEYEKIYGDREHSILTVMDGVLSTEYKRLFLLTTNSLYINDNMLSRPSRIRYIKEFKDLSLKIINEIVDDMLEYPALKEEVVKYIATLRIITVDIVKSVVDEVNMHGQSPEEFKDIFNVKMRDEKYNVYDITDGEEHPIKVFSEVQVTPAEFNSDSVAGNAHRFAVNSTTIGTIKKLINRNTIIVEVVINTNGKLHPTKEMFLEAVKSDNLLDLDDLQERIEEARELAEDNQSGENTLHIAAVEKLAKAAKVITRVLKIEQTYGSHYSFTRYSGGGYDF